MSSQSDIYGQIETRYKFSIPAEYRRMWEMGWFKFDDEKNCVGPDYFWLNDMEWFDPPAIRDHEFPDYCLPGFVPFAVTGGGDHWCWFPAESIDGVTPVVQCFHDSKIGNFDAPSFPGAMYRQMLEYAGCGLGSEEESEARANLKRWHDLFGSFVPAHWRATLARLQTAPLQSWEFGRTKIKQYGLLLPEECKAIIQRDLAFAKLDGPFQWMLA